MTYQIEHRYDRSGWTPRERFTAADDLEALAELEAEIARSPLDFLRLVETFDFDGLRCGRVVREHVEEIAAAASNQESYADAVHRRYREALRADLRPWKGDR
jgi:ribulose bisphosphate carboxylase small subunit